MTVCMQSFPVFLIYHFATIIWINTVLLLQIVMVSPGTPLVKNHESQSGINESQLKKNSVTLKMLGP